MNKAKLLVISGHVGSTPHYLDIVQSNHWNYCKRHNYDYHFESELEISDCFADSSRFVTYSWLKVFLALAKLRENKWTHVFWIDSDSIFHKIHLDLNDIILLDKELVFTGDSWDVFNTGHFLLRNSTWSKRFLENWLEMRNVKLPLLKTSHKSEYGRLVDQPAANILIGKTSVEERDLEGVFNRMNGYKGNSDRTHKWFHLTHAPTNRIKLRNCTKLISPEYQEQIGVVIQNRLNGYPFGLPGYRANPKSCAILHFPSGSKNLIRDYAKSVDF